MLYDQTESGKYNMVACKPPVPISQRVDMQDRDEIVTPLAQWRLTPHMT